MREDFSSVARGAGSFFQIHKTREHAQKEKTNQHEENTMSQNREELYRKMEDALARFPYRKAAALYQTMNWTWCGSNMPPDEEEIRETARSLAQAALKEFLSTEASTRSSSGGIVVNIWKWKSSVEVEVLMAPFSESA